MAQITAANGKLINKMNRTSAKLTLGDKMALWQGKVIASGTQATVGGTANQTITIAGALSTDIAMVVLNTVGATPRTVLTAKAAAGQINVVMSGDPSTDHNISYMLIRAL